MAPAPALLTYEAFAAFYDELNHTNDYEMWLGQALLPELRKRGLMEGGGAQFARAIPRRPEAWTSTRSSTRFPAASIGIPQ